MQMLKTAILICLGVPNDISMESVDSGRNHKEGKLVTYDNENRTELVGCR